jgi:hypothetical protein
LLAGNYRILNRLTAAVKKYYYEEIVTYNTVAGSYYCRNAM